MIFCTFALLICFVCCPFRISNGSNKDVKTGTCICCFRAKILAFNRKSTDSEPEKFPDRMTIPHAK